MRAVEDSWVYGHLGTAGVKVGEHVEGGKSLGVLPGNEADLHFEVREQGKAVDPVPWLAAGSGFAVPSRSR